jgi:hypothetical protein
MGGWPWPLSAVQGWFEGLYSSVFSVLDTLKSWVTAIGNSIISILQPAIRAVQDNLANFVLSLINQVKGSLDFFVGFIKTQADGLGNLMISVVGKVADSLTFVYSMLVGALAAIPGQVTGAVGSAFTEVANTILQGLNQFVQWILQGLTLFWNFLTQTVVPTITNAIVVAFNFLKDLFTNTFRAIMQILGIGAPLEPENALIHAIEVAIPAFLVNFGIFLAATSSDLLHPLKGTGVVPSAIEIVRSLGPEIVSGAIVGSYAFAVVEAPLKLYWHSLARPTRPRGPLTDRMFFHGAIDMPTVRKMMAYEGFPDWAIDAWVRSWWQEPSDRLIIALVDDPSIPPGWIRTKLQDRGYSAVDIDVLVNYAQNKALGKVKGSREGTVITRYSQGYISDDEFTQELLALGYRPELISKARAAAVLGRDTDERKELVKVWTEQFRKDLLTVDEFRSNLETVLVSTRLIESIIELERARRFPTPKRPAGV